MSAQEVNCGVLHRTVYCTQQQYVVSTAMTVKQTVNFYCVFVILCVLFVLCFLMMYYYKICTNSKTFSLYANLLTF